MIARLLKHDREYSRTSISQFMSKHGVPRLSAKSKVLDAGSGNLSEQTFRDEIVASGARLTTCDVKANDGVDVVANLHRLPFEDQSFNVIFCLQVLEHIRNPDQVCAEFYRVLQPGGFAIITVPQITHTLSDGEPPHYFNFTRYGLEIVLHDAGFTTELIESQGGHFCVLGHLLHYSVRVLTASSLPSLIKAPAILACRGIFGGLMKPLFKWLDVLDTHQRSSLGWNICVTKPAEP